MKRNILLIFSLVFALSSMAQIQVWKKGQIDFEENTTKIDSITFNHIEVTTPDPILNDFPITVKAKKPARWSTVYLWAWGNMGDLFSAWPGTELNTDDDGLYTYTFDESITQINVIFSNEGSPQTDDINGLKESTCFILHDDGSYEIAEYGYIRTGSK